MTQTNKSNRKASRQQEDSKPSGPGKIVSFFKNSSVHFVVGLFFLMFAVFLMLSFLSFFMTGAADQSVLESVQGMSSTEEVTENVSGLSGAFLAEFLINHAFGVSSIFIVVFIGVMGLKLMKVAKVRLWKWFICCTMSMLWLSVFLGFSMKHLYEDSFFYLGGTHGYNISNWLEMQIGVPGVWLLLIFTFLCLLVYISAKTVVYIQQALSFGFLRKKKTNDETAEEGQVPEEFIQSWGGDDKAKPTQQPEEDQPSEQPLHVSVEAPKGDDDIDENEPDDEDDDQPGLDIEIEAKEDEVIDKDYREPYNPRLDLEYYNLPTIDLKKHFEDDGPVVNQEEQDNNIQKIVDTLRSFGIEISSIKGTVGPTVTLYEITPAAGIRISKIKNLEDDIALNLSALGIRIIAPIPGKGTIGIEVPNKDARVVSGQSVIGCKRFQETNYELPLALGKTISNEVFMVDLVKMPHILVAGATGQGKSVGLNAMIASLLYKKHPSELKFVLIDPKKVEFSIYSDLEHHFLAELPDSTEPVVTDVKKVVSVLNSLCLEMDTRYDLLKKAHVRNIKEYNKKFIDRMLNPENGHRYLPYIVVIIDEFGDLIMTAGKDVELPIARIAQLARAVGIHMIIATQRPTTNIITGTIKANFPARIAFRVMQQIDSRTILDRTGANQLIGKGDMLFLAGNDPVRVQCAFIDTPEIENIVQYIAKQQGYPTPFYLPEVAEEEGGDDISDVDMHNLDPMFADAARLIVSSQSGSTSLIQRKFSIGYNRAGRLMDQLEKAGIVGPAQGSKPREVLCLDLTELEAKLNNLL